MRSDGYPEGAYDYSSTVPSEELSAAVKSGHRWTHVENLEGPINLSPPAACYTREGEDRKKPALIPRCLDLRYGSAIETLVSG